MSKILPVLFAVLALGHCSRAAIIAEPTHLEVHEPTLTKVGEIVEHVPTAVSHQSSTIVHSKEKRVTPVLAAGMRSYTASGVRTYSSHEPPMVGVMRSVPPPPPPPLFAAMRSLMWPGGPAASFVHAHAPTIYVTPNGAAYGYAAYPYYHPAVYGPSTDYRR